MDKIIEIDQIVKQYQSLPDTERGTDTSIETAGRLIANLIEIVRDQESRIKQLEEHVNIDNYLK